MCALVRNDRSAYNSVNEYNTGEGRTQVSFPNLRLLREFDSPAGFFIAEREELYYNKKNTVNREGE